jgi:anti-anti-sigma factor
MTLTVLPPSSHPAPNARCGCTTPVARVDIEGTRSVVVLRGDVDVFTTLVVSDLLSGLAVSVAGDVVIDLGEVDFVDAAAVTAFVSAQQLLACRGRRLTFRSPSSLAARVLDVFGLAGVIETGD